MPDVKEEIVEEKQSDSKEINVNQEVKPNETGSQMNEDNFSEPIALRKSSRSTVIKTQQLQIELKLETERQAKTKSVSPKKKTKTPKKPVAECDETTQLDYDESKCIECQKERPKQIVSYIWKLDFLI